MLEPKLTDVHQFITHELKEEIRKRYLDYQIITEADLQAHVYEILSAYLRRKSNNPDLLKVLIGPFLKEPHLRPDLVIFRRKKAWVVMEFKEKKKLTPKEAEDERAGLWDLKKHFKSLKRGFLFYVARRGDGKPVTKTKKKDKTFFYEIPIVPHLRPPELKKWEDGRKYWNKYTSK